MVDRIKIGAQISIEYPVYFLPFNRVCKRIKCIVLAASRSEAIREAEKIRFVYGIEYLDDGSLNDLIFQRSDPQRSFATIWFGDHPSA
jgi:hypothetical protein